MNDNSRFSAQEIAQVMTPHRFTLGADQKPVTPGAAYRAFMDEPQGAAAAARNRMIERQTERKNKK
jgi:hypothetical protein